MENSQSTALGKRISDNISHVIIGKEEIIFELLISLLCGGHVLLEDVPGTGKTMLAKSLARSLDMDFKRIQFTPDLLPSDVTGMSIYSQKDGDFIFRPGPVFTNILLADEINRATPRSQAALLECMEEAQVTNDSQTYALPQPFLVIATQNPIETQGTFPLPEAQLDRFLMKLSMGYPTHEEGVAILARFMSGEPLQSLSPVANAEELSSAMAEARRVRIHEDILSYMSALAEYTRGMDNVALGASPRAVLALMRAAQARAYLLGRGYVSPDDAKQLAVPVFAHRVICRNQYSSASSAGREVVEYALSHVRVPTEHTEELP